jgi:citrate synthase
MLLDKEQKIARPRQIYVGPEERQYRSRLAAK